MRWGSTATLSTAVTLNADRMHEGLHILSARALGMAEAMRVDYRLAESVTFSCLLGERVTGLTRETKVS